MGHKVHPTGFRLGIIYDWQSKWYADRHYTELLHEDLTVRRTIMRGMADAGISRVEIDRNANQVVVTVHTAKPGIVIGRGGQKVDELRLTLERLTGRRVRVNISEIRQPELDAYLVARSVADQLQRRVSFRRALKQALARTMQRGAKGVKIMVAGRLGGAEMSRRETNMEGRVPLHTLRADIDYGMAEAHTSFGRIGVKAWIYKGDIIRERKTPPAPEEPEVEESAGVGAAPPAAAPEGAAVQHEGVAPPAAAPEGAAVQHEGVAPPTAAPEVPTAQHEGVAPPTAAPEGAAVQDEGAAPPAAAPEVPAAQHEGVAPPTAAPEGPAPQDEGAAPPVAAPEVPTAQHEGAAAPTAAPEGPAPQDETAAPAEGKPAAGSESEEQ